MAAMSVKSAPTLEQLDANALRALVRIPVKMTADSGLS
jgi:hypothetical protein